MIEDILLYLSDDVIFTLNYLEFNKFLNMFMNHLKSILFSLIFLSKIIIFLNIKLIFQGAHKFTFTHQFSFLQISIHLHPHKQLYLFGMNHTPKKLSFFLEIKLLQHFKLSIQYLLLHFLEFFKLYLHDISIQVFKDLSNISWHFQFLNLQNF